MSQQSKILLQLFVKPFYTENASAFVVVFTMMFVIVGETHGAGLYKYHYSLAIGMLSSPIFLLAVFFLWALYARKYISFVSESLRRQEFGFMDIYNRLPKSRQFALLLLMQLCLLLPVILYAVFVLAIGFSHQYYLSAISILIYLMVICVLGVVWHLHCLHHLEIGTNSLWQAIKRIRKLPSSYVAIVLQFIASKQKAAWMGLKVFTCGILYLIARNNTTADYDMTLPFLFFSFGILANGIIVHRVREFENLYLPFYRGLQVPLVSRFLQYCLIYSILLIPEILTISLLMPVHLQYQDAVSFALTALSVLLLLNSIMFIQDYTRKEFAVILLLAFGVEYIFLLTTGLAALYGGLFLLSAILFFRCYYKFDKVF